MDELIILFYAVAIVFGLTAALLFYKFYSLKKQLDEEFRLNPHFEDPNDDGKDISLTTINGFGKSLQGRFRKATIGAHNSFVAYHTTMLLFFVIPGRCYRVIPVNSNMSQAFHIIGSDVEDKREKTCIILRFYGIWATGFAILAVSAAILFS